MSTRQEVISADEAKLQKFKAEKLEEQVTMRRVAEHVKHLKSIPRPNKSNLQTEQRYYEIKKAKFEKEHFILQTSFITVDRHSCLMPIEDLTNITLKEMSVNYLHLGRFLKCTVSADAFYASGMHLLVRDSNGDTEHIVLYNYETSAAFTIDPKHILPVGTELIIKEPYLQYLGQHSDDFGIRVDSPSDVVVNLDISQDLVTTDGLIEEANRQFGLKHYHQASRLYTLAIGKSDGKSIRAHLNRAQCFLKLEKYQAAYEDAKQATELDIDDEMEQKACYRMGKALYQMRKWEMAKDSFEECLNLGENKEAEEGLKKTLDRLREAKTGEFNFDRLYEDFFRRQEMQMDVADYKSDKIDVAEIANKSKGMLAKKNIKKGTLLVVSKAASSVFNTKVDSRLKGYNLVQCAQGSYNSRNEVENVSNLIYSMSNNPDLAAQIYSLYAGPGYSRDPLPASIIDVQRIEAICVFNSFLIKNSYELLQLKQMDEQLETMPNYNEEDFTELDLSSIDFQSAPYQQLAQMQVKYENLDKQCGLWHMVSFFNHSCVANCSVQFIGDIIVIHTIRDIEKNEEVTIRYFPPDLTYTQRNQRAQESYGFSCDCLLCHLDAQDPMNISREKFLEKIEETNSNEHIDISTALTNLQKMKCTYLKRPQWQLLMVTPLDILADCYKVDNQLEKAADTLEEIFQLIKDHNDLVAVTVLIRLKNICRVGGLANKYKTLAFELFQLINLHPVYYEKLWDKILEM